MVSMQAAFSSEGRKPSPNLDNDLSKKRKCHQDHGGDAPEKLAKEPRLSSVQKLTNSRADYIELNIDTPLPLEWQRCLDIKSGQIHFYNTRTHARTSKDPRESLEPLSSCAVSLDLELNLTCKSDNRSSQLAHENERPKRELISGSKNNSSGLPSPTSIDADRREMLAAVCARCHMLVMMCKASPSCPNCKFAHPPPDKSSSSPPLLKPELRLLCCRD